MAEVTPIKPLISALLISLRRRSLERAVDGPYDDTVSRELDQVIVEMDRRWREREGNKP